MFPICTLIGTLFRARTKHKRALAFRELNLFPMKKISVRLFVLPVAAVVLACGISTGRSATLTAVPMQGGMVMPMVAYHAEHGHLHVTVDPTVPQLTPLLASNPADNFDAGDPWFNALDPSRQGMSFSRRYGFVMNSVTDALPPNTQIWIRKLTGAASLKFYRYAANVPKAFDPIFGTDGVTNAMYWNGVMFHPAVAAPPGTNHYLATFEVYLLDTTTGLELPGSASGPFAFNFTNVPDGRPALNLAQRIVVGWPADTTSNWVLESAAAADAMEWTTVTNAPVTLDGEPGVVLESNESQRFFRMRYVP